MTRGHRNRGPKGLRRLLPAVVLMTLLGACSDSSGTSGPAGERDPLKPSASADQGQQRVAHAALDEELSVATGELDQASASEASAAVAAVVDDWLVRAYLSGPWPRTEFSSAWRNFSQDLAARARAERSVTSNADMGARLSGVRAEQRVVRVDVFGVDNKAVGATARVRLVFVTEGDARMRVSITGELNLVPSGESWAVFGYDLQRSQEPLPEPGGATP